MVPNSPAVLPVGPVCYLPMTPDPIFWLRNDSLVNVRECFGAMCRAAGLGTAGSGLRINITLTKEQK